MAFHYSPKIITNGLITYLDAANTKSYISGDTTWIDLSKNDKNGTLVNGTTFNSNNLGSLTFDGLNDYVSVPKAVVTNTFTINAWINPSGVSQTGSTGYLGIVNKFNGYNGQRNRFLLQSGFNLLYFQAAIGAVTYDIPSDNFSSIFNQNSMVTVVYNGSDFRFYVNGVSVMATPFPVSGNLDSGSLNAIIGWGATSVDYFFNGKIYLYQVYNTALSANDVLQNYNALKGRYQ